MLGSHTCQEQNDLFFRVVLDFHSRYPVQDLGDRRLALKSTRSSDGRSIRRGGGGQGVVLFQIDVAIVMLLVKVVLVDVAVVGLGWVRVRHQDQRRRGRRVE